MSPFLAIVDDIVAAHLANMRTAHRGMNISEQEYLAVVDDIMAALRHHKIDDTTQKDVLVILYGLKGEIVRG